MSLKRNKMHHNNDDSFIRTKKKNNKKALLAGLAVIGIGAVISGITGAALVNYSSVKQLSTAKPVINLSSNNYSQTIFFKQDDIKPFEIEASANFNTQLHYQWYSGVPNKKSIVLEGANENTFLPSANLDKSVANNSFYVVVSGINSDGAVISSTSKVFSLNVIKEPTITFSAYNKIQATLNETNYQIIDSDATCNNKTISLSYQWYKSTANNITSINQFTSADEISGANQSAYILQSNDVNALGTTYYYVYATGSIDNKSFSSLSNAYIVTVSKTASINVSYNQTITYGTKGYSGSTITANVVSSTPLEEKFQWYTNNPAFANTNNILKIGTEDFYAIPDANYEWYSLTKTDTSMLGSWNYCLEVTSSQNGVQIVSNNENNLAEVVIWNTPTINITDSNNFQVNGYLNQTQNLILKPEIEISNENDKNGFCYQWYSNDFANNTNGAIMENETSSTLVLSGNELNKTKMYFYLVVTCLIPNTSNGIISATSAVFTVTLSDAPTKKISIGNITSSIIANNNEQELVIYNNNLNNLPTLSLEFNQALSNDVDVTTNWYYAINENGSTTKVLIAKNSSNLVLANYIKQLATLWKSGGEIYAISSITDSANDEQIQINTSSSFNVLVQTISATISYPTTSYSLYIGQSLNLPKFNANIKYTISGQTSALSYSNLTYQWYKNDEVISTKTNPTANSLPYILQNSETINQKENAVVNYYLMITIVINGTKITLGSKTNAISVTYKQDPSIEVVNNLPSDLTNGIAYFLTSNQITDIPTLTASVINLQSYVTNYVWMIKNIYSGTTQTFSTTSAKFDLSKILSTPGKYEIWMVVNGSIYGVSISGTSQTNPFMIVINPAVDINLTTNSHQSVEVGNIYNISAEININDLNLNESNFQDWNTLNAYDYEIQAYTLSSALSINAYNNLFIWQNIKSGQLTFNNSNKTISSTISYQTLMNDDALPVLQYRIVILQNNSNNQFISSILSVQPEFSSQTAATNNLNSLLANPDYDMGLIWQYNLNQTNDYNNNFLNTLTQVEQGASYHAVSGEYFEKQWWVTLQNISYIAKNTDENTYNLNANTPFSSFVLTYQITDAEQIVDSDSSNSAIATFLSGSTLKLFLPLNFFQTSVTSSINNYDVYTINKKISITNNTSLSWSYSTSSGQLQNIFFNLYHIDNKGMLATTWSYPDINNLEFDSQTTAVTSNGYSWFWLPIYKIS